MMEAEKTGESKREMEPLEFITVAKAVKVTDARRERKFGIVAQNIIELTTKCQQKFNIQVTGFVLDDGTEVTDDEYFATLPAGTLLMVLTEGEEWVEKSDGDLKRKDTLYDLGVSVGQGLHSNESSPDTVSFSTPQEIEGMQVATELPLTTPFVQSAVSTPVAQSVTTVVQGPSNQFVNTETPSVNFNLDSVCCCICMERRREAFLIPCGHTFCMVCAVAQEPQQTLKRCSICRRNVDGVGQTRA